MSRLEMIRAVMDLVTEEIVVSNLGHPSQELFGIRDRPRNFYMLGSMGLCSSIALGIALSSQEKVIALEGDGAMLMNLGSLATIGAMRPKNLALVIFDNGAYGSTGYQPTFTATTTRLADVARACGIERTIVIETAHELSAALRLAIAEGLGPNCIIAKVPPVAGRRFEPVPLSGPRIRARFMGALRGAGF